MGQSEQKDKLVMERIGQRIQQARRQLGLSQEQLAKALSVDRVSVTRYEDGTRTPHASNFPKLAQILKVPIAFFFENPDQPE